MKLTAWVSGPWILLAALLMAGCNEVDEDYDDITPSAGMGALIVENNSPMDFDVYTDGLPQGAVDDGDHIVVDLNPGLVRIFLREQDGDHSGESDEVEILEGRRTILRIYRDDRDWNDYELKVEYD